MTTDLIESPAAIILISYNVALADFARSYLIDTKVYLCLVNFTTEIHSACKLYLCTMQSEPTTTKCC